MNTKRSLFLFAGEQSGDLHGAALASEIKKTHPEWSLKGVSGPAMRAQGINGSLTVEDFSVMGFTDVFKSIPKLIRQFFQVRNQILNENPDAVVMIDYPGFNIRLAKSLRKKGYKGKLLQYICPSVWAHGKGRIKHMERDLDLLLTIFPFETACFDESRLKVRFSGNPLVDKIKTESNPNAVGDRNFIAIFPGSRVSEIDHNLPMQLEAANLFAKKHPEVRFAISIANEKVRHQIRDIASQSPIEDKISFYDPEDHYLLMRKCGFAMATSGTVTLELALHKRPTVVSYVVTPLNAFIIRYFLRLKLKSYCIANILADERIFPELMEQRPTAALINSCLEKLFQDPSQAILGCEKIQAMLKTPQPASLTAAYEIEELLK